MSHRVNASLRSKALEVWLPSRTLLLGCSCANHGHQTHYGLSALLGKCQQWFYAQFLRAKIPLITRPALTSKMEFGGPIVPEHCIRLSSCNPVCHSLRYWIVLLVWRPGSFSGSTSDTAYWIYRTPDTIMVETYIERQAGSVIMLFPCLNSKCPKFVDTLRRIRIWTNIGSEYLA